MFYVLPIAVVGLFIDSVHVTVQEIHIYAAFCCTGLAAVRENPLLSEKIAYHPNFRRRCFNALIESLVLNVNFACIAQPVTMGFHTLQG